MSFNKRFLYTLALIASSSLSVVAQQAMSDRLAMEYNPQQVISEAKARNDLQSIYWMIETEDEQRAHNVLVEVMAWLNEHAADGLVNAGEIQRQTNTAMRAHGFRFNLNELGMFNPADHDEARDDAIAVSQSRVVHHPPVTAAVTTTTAQIGLPAAIVLQRHHAAAQTTNVQAATATSHSSSSTSSSSSSTATKAAVDERECPTCSEDVDVREFPRLSCGHTPACRACLTRMIDNRVLREQNSRNFKCPERGCGGQLTRADFTTIINDAQKLARYDAIVEGEHPDARVCPGVDCTFRYRHIPGQPRTKTCQMPRCGIQFCSACMKNHPEGVDCELAKRYRESGAEVLIRQITKKCPRCQWNIEKDGGCNHMTCGKCKYEFCWHCFTRWPCGDSSYYCQLTQNGQLAAPAAAGQEFGLAGLLGAFLNGGAQQAGQAEEAGPQAHIGSIVRNTSIQQSAIAWDVTIKFDKQTTEEFYMGFVRRMRTYLGRNLVRGLPSYRLFRDLASEELRFTVTMDRVQDALRDMLEELNNPDND